MNKKRNKASNAILNARVLDLVPLMTMLSRHEILEYIIKEREKCENPNVKRKKWFWKNEVATSQVDNYIRKASDILIEQFNEHKKLAFEKSYNNVANLYKKAFQDGDWKTCLAMQEKIDKLAGIDKSQASLLLSDVSVSFAGVSPEDFINSKKEN